jgi:predicted amidohydrolase
MQSNPLKIGLGQLLVEGGEPMRNLKRAVDMVQSAAALHCALIVLPETLDFAWTHPNGLTEAESIPGKFSDVLCEAAKANSIYICAGLTEKGEDGKNYNAALLISPTGEIILKYHKINLLEVEQPFYAPGKKLEVVQTEIGRIGVNICADNYFESLCIGHTLGRMGAQLILSPASWTVDFGVNEVHDPYGEKWVKPLGQLAMLFDLVVVSTTSVGYIVGGPYEGKKSIGCSLAVGPKGIIAQGAFNEFAGELITCEVELTDRKETGTALSSLLQSKGYQFG